MWNAGTRFSCVIIQAAVLILVVAARAGAVGDLEFLSRANVPPNVMLVLDNSGSMRTDVDGVDRIQAAGDTLVNFVNLINPDDGNGGYTENARLGPRESPCLGSLGPGAGQNPADTNWDLVRFCGPTPGLRDTKGEQTVSLTCWCIGRIMVAQGRIELPTP